MKPLIVLVTVFFIALIVCKLTNGNYDVVWSGRMAMAAMLFFTATAHLVFTQGMMLMVPSFIPFKKEVVYLTGVFEVIAAVSLLIASTKVIGGWAIIVFFILLLPGNIKAAIEHLDYQKGTYDGNGPAYLWFRVPLQLLFIAWTYLTAILF